MPHNISCTQQYTIHTIHKVKVKVTLVQALRLCTGRMAHRGSRGIALLFHDHGTRSGWGVSVTPRPLFTPGKDPVLIVQEVGWAPRLVWTGAENLAPTWIRSPDRPAHSQSLHQLSYTGPWTQFMHTIFLHRSGTKFSVGWTALCSTGGCSGCENGNLSSRVFLGVNPCSLVEV